MYISDNENANNILKLNDSPIIYPETPSLLANASYFSFHQTEMQEEKKEIIIIE